MQILVGGRTEEKSVNLATLSGKQELSNKLFVSASNFMIIKFSTDASVERKGFRASWKTEPQTCGGILRATPQGQVLTSPGYPQNYPGGLECLYILQAQPGRIMSLEVKRIKIATFISQTSTQSGIEFNYKPPLTFHVPIFLFLVKIPRINPWYVAIKFKNARLTRKLKSRVTCRSRIWTSR